MGQGSFGSSTRAFVVWNTPPEDRTRRSHGQSLRPHDLPVNRNGGDQARL